MSAKYVSELVWDDESVDRLRDLERLIRLVQMFESANNFPKHLVEAIELANRLDRRNLTRRRPSFLGWLNRSVDDAVRRGPLLESK